MAMAKAKMKLLQRSSNNSSALPATIGGGVSGGSSRGDSGQRDASNTTTHEIDDEWDGSTIHSYDDTHGLPPPNGTDHRDNNNSNIIDNDENEGNYRANHHHHHRSSSFNNDGTAPANKLLLRHRKRHSPNKQFHSTSSLLSFSSKKSTTTSSSSSKLQLFHKPQQQLHLPKILHRKPKREVQIAEARHRAALRLQPPPFDTENLVRLHELKEAKLKLNLSGDPHGKGGNNNNNNNNNNTVGEGSSSSSSICSRSASIDDSNNCRHENNHHQLLADAATSSSNSLTSFNSTIPERGSTGNRKSSQKMTSLATRHGLIFLGVTLLHLAMAFLPYYIPKYPHLQLLQQQLQQQQQQQHASIILLSLLQIILQSISLRYLLTSTLLYSFDNIDFGQFQLVRNMKYMKQMFVSMVVYYSKGVAVGSLGISMGMGWLLSWLNGDGDGGIFSNINSNDQWCLRAYDISLFLTTRLGVFVLAALLLGHFFLPPPKITTSMEGNTTNLRQLMKVVEEEEDEEHESKEDNRRVPRHSQSERQLTMGAGRRGNKRVGALSWSATFVLAAATAVTASSNYFSPPAATSSATSAQSSILVAGSLNADTFLPVHRFPSPGENLTLIRNQHPMVDVPGGKGCNQAVACAKLSSSKHQAGEETKVSFLGQFGNDSASDMLREALVNNNVDVSPSGQSKLYPSGRGYVMIVPETGEVCAVVSGGSNLYGWEDWGVSRTDDDGPPTTVDGRNSHTLSDRDIGDVVSSHSLLLLQCEIPSLVNLRLAREARKLNIPVLLDVGGEDRKMERELLECCDYLIPNETELKRLAKSCQDASFDEDLEDGSLLLGMTRQELGSIQEQIGSTLNLPVLIKSIRTLQRNGANNVLVTLGSHGSILMKKEKQHSSSALPSRRPLIYRPACKLPAGLSVVDETGAGDCYRAGFAVALLENCIGNSMIGEDDEVDDEVLEQCMKFASAAGALAVTRKGAVPSIPSRVEVEKLLSENSKDGHVLSPSEGVPRGGGHKNDKEDDFPFLFGSRINSMKDRLDLVDPSMLPLSTPRDYLRRMATIRGLGCVDFNFPQHFDGHWTPEEAKKALDEVNLVAGAVCLRYPSKFARGAMNHPNAELRREAIEITKQAAEAARILGCNEVVVWSAYDGYDYPFQVSYREKWDQIVQAFQECCDAYPDIKWSLEFKPTDENTRFFTVPSTGAAMLLVNEIDRPNMGLTLDMGHMLMAGENPGQSIAMVGGKLYGIQLNDGYTRLAAEDGMMFGSIHPSIALEALHQLRQINFSGHLYFDTFPQRTDPVKEAEYNIRRVKEFWSAVTKLDAAEVARIAREHDAIGALELVSEALKR
ncbi:hypothetical protein ACHAWU_003820 [Discostella pseudostelligera]|uniref:Ribokinase n=1 Tax=Discostella pseudostelligera TaxID=259834 RepID=A0ABD3NEH6_9STRA